jgi:hypothetical protein
LHTDILNCTIDHGELLGDLQYHSAMENQMTLLSDEKFAVTVTRLAWRLEDISRETGLSVPFLRKEIRNKKLRMKRKGRCVLVLDADLKAYLAAE